MKKILIIFISLFLLIIVSCSDEMKNQKNKIIVEKRIGDEDKYEHYNDITDIQNVRLISELLDSITWHNGAINTIVPPDYKFYFENEDEKANEIVYGLWTNYNREVTIVIDSNSKLANLDEPVSVKLLNLITNKKEDN